MVVMAVFLVVAVLAVGLLFLRLHTLPERMAHKSHKLQFEIVAVLGLLALFTHMHIFWVAGLLLALIDIPDFGRPLAGSPDRSRGSPASARREGADEVPDEPSPTPRREGDRLPKPGVATRRSRSKPVSQGGRS